MYNNNMFYLILRQVQFFIIRGTHWENILDARVRHIVKRTIGENQLGFRKERGTDDELLAIR